MITPIVGNIQPFHHKVAMSVQMTDPAHDGSHRRDHLLSIDDNDVVIGGDSGSEADVIVVAGGGTRRLRSYQRISVSRDGPSHRYDQLTPPRNRSDHHDDDDDAQPRLLGGRRCLAGGKCCLLIAAFVVVVCLVVVELVPPSLFLAIRGGAFDSLLLATVQVVLLALLCVFVVLLGIVGGTGADWATPRLVVGCGGSYLSTADVWLIALNILPPAAWALASYWTETGEGESSSSSSSSRNIIRFLRIVDGIGVVTARLARLDLAVSILLSSRGHSTWLLQATAGWLGLPETMSLHQSSGWWCVAQSAVHSISYLIFYYLEGGFESIRFNCFPVPDSRPGGCGEINRLGLVNFLGLVAFAAAMVPFLFVPALPWFRSSGYYHVFQRIHILAAIAFVFASALHDLPVLTFAIPGIADWLIGRWREFRRCRRLTARARLLIETSGPWVELAIDRSRLMRNRRRRPSPRGEWALLRVPALGGEVHPFTVATFPSSSSIVTALITTKGGNWTRELAALAATDGDGGSELEVDLYGPFESGGGDWSLIYEPALLLIVGGTGIFGYLPAFAAEMNKNQFLHLVWCVKTMSDYRELAAMLPSQDRRVMITVFVTDEHFRVDIVGDSCVDDATTASEAQSDFGIEGSRCQEMMDNIDRQEKSIDCQRPEAFASLATALSGLAFIRWGWTGIKTVLLPIKPSSLMSYMLWWRLMPVVYVLAVVTITTVLSSWLANLLTRRNRGAESFLSSNRGRSPVDLLNYCGEGESHRVGVQECDDNACPRDECGRHFQAGRPDLTTLVRSAAESAARRMAGRLMVVVCGPTELLQSSQNAVTLIREEGCGVRLCFSGTDSRW